MPETIRQRYQKPFDPLADVGLVPGTTVMVFDSRLYVNDIETPLSHTMRKATVLCHYGEMETTFTAFGAAGSALKLGPYKSMVDVKFEYDGRVSKGHFTWGIDLIK